MYLKQAFLIFFGLCAGGVIAAGIFAFLAIIGVFPRVIGKTKTNSHIFLYETIIIIGGAFGNALDIYEFPVPLGIFGQAAVAVFGVCVGVFVGCLVMSLAETLKALPVINRRIHLAVGLQYLILSIALGKLVGSLVYFTQGISS